MRGPSALLPTIAARFARGLLRCRRLHRDEEGTISIISVIALLVFTMILGMVMNVGRQVDDKVKLQNSVDAATYTGGVVVARGMNSIAFTNHLLSEIFALTAYMREGRDKSSAALVPEILDAWEQIGPIFAGSSFQKFARLGPAISQKVPLERELVRTFTEMTSMKAQVTLPVLEYILGQPEQQGGQTQPVGNQPSGGQQQTPAQTHLIPEFQRAVVLAIPGVAQAAVSQIARRHASPEANGPRQAELTTLLWRTRVLPVGFPSESDPRQRTLPAIDPSFEGPDAQQMPASELAPYQAQASQRRRQLARHYLEEWIRDRSFDLAPFERETMGEGGKVSGKMSQFINLWRIFTCGQLERLLTVEFPTTNLPHMIRRSQNSPNGINLDDDHMFVGVLYWPQKSQILPGMFRSPIRGHAQTFAQVFVYIPRPRYQTGGGCPTWYCQRVDYFSGDSSCHTPCFDGWPSDWDLFNQNWTAKIVPATVPSIAAIVQTPPGDLAPGVQLPNLGGMSNTDLGAINTH